MRKLIVPAVLLLALAATLGRADEGSIPIFSQTTITEPGHYVVTRDFSYATGSGVLVQAINVTLDLNGHTITGPACSGAGEAAITINSPVASKGVVIKNGRLLDGCYGITAYSSARLNVRIDHVEIGGSGLQGISIVALESVQVLNCHIHDVASIYGINLRGNPGGSTAYTFTGRVSDNIVERVGSEGILLQGLVAGEVRRNVVTDFGANATNHAGIHLYSESTAGGNLVEGNTVTVGSLATSDDDDGIRVSAMSRNDVILNNVITGTGRDGILSSAEGTRIERNSVNGCGGNGIESSGSGTRIEGNVSNSNGFEGIRVTGDESRIERNVANYNGTSGIRIGSTVVATKNNYLEGNQAQMNGATSGTGCGIEFDPSTSGNPVASRNVYRDNNVRDNPVMPPASCNWTGNVDGGGNIQ